MPLAIDVVSDVVCPWCYIGKRKLERALAMYRAQRPDADAPVVNWHPFQLNPDLPREGLPRREYIERKFGAGGGAVYDRVKVVGSSVGIPFAFELVERQPNTLSAHSLIAVAGTLGLQDAMKEALLRAYFIEGQDLTSDATLEAIATSCGMSADDARMALFDPGLRGQVAANDRSARDMGIDGVPFFIFNRRLAVSGAQDADVLLAAMLEAEQEAAARPEPAN